ncbi:MAG: cell wall-binding repeat-containing protein [Actinobacteria bacterium]|nr:cell wall-binding repeat-containing protein [Actinomycetota bacterium]
MTLWITVGAAVVPLPQAAAAENATPQSLGVVERIWGTSRFDTAAAISAAVFDPGVPVAYVATGLNFPDAIAGAAATGGQSPILLVSTDTIPQSTADELVRLQPGRIVVLGGTAVISPSVEAALAAYTTGTVTRLSGADRYASAAAVSAATFAPGVPVAYIATGVNFPDALAGGPVGALRGGPILLVGSSIPAATANELVRLAPGEIVVLGGTLAVSQDIETALNAYTSGSVRRLSGSNRYATAAAISSDYFAPGVPVVYVATGLNYPDAIAGGPAAARQGGPVLLVEQDAVPYATGQELLRLATSRIVVLGGTGAVSDAVRIELATYLAPVAVDDAATTSEGTFGCQRHRWESGSDIDDRADGTAARCVGEQR